MKFLKLSKQILILPLFLSGAVFSSIQIIQPSSNAYEEIQEALILAEPGDVIRLTAGTFILEDSLSLDVDNVQIEGEGMHQTILDFKNQKSGAQGLSVTSDNVTLQDFSIHDANGDAIKVKGVENIKFLRVKTEWTNGPDPQNLKIWEGGQSALPPPLRLGKSFCLPFALTETLTYSPVRMRLDKSLFM